jgi:hypothetical protein
VNSLICAVFVSMITNACELEADDKYRIAMVHYEKARQIAREKGSSSEQVRSLKKAHAEMQKIVLEYPDTNTANRILVDTRIGFSAKAVERKLSLLGVKAKIEQRRPDIKIKRSQDQDIAAYAVAELSSVYDELESQASELFSKVKAKFDFVDNSNESQNTSSPVDPMQTNNASIKDDRVDKRSEVDLAIKTLNTDENNKVSDIPASAAPLTKPTLPKKLPIKKPRARSIELMAPSAITIGGKSNPALPAQLPVESTASLIRSEADKSPVNLVNLDDGAVAVSVPEKIRADKLNSEETLLSHDVENKKIIFEKEIATVFKDAAQNDKSPEKAALNSVVNQTLKVVSKKFERGIPGTRLEITSNKGQKLEFGLLTVQPVFESTDLRHTIFVQGSAASRDGGDQTTLNIGLGHRLLTRNEDWLLGYNVFFDNEFPYDHQRASFGLEAKSAALEFTTNFYKPLTGLKQHGGSPLERALGGHDYEIGMQIPYMPSTRLYAKRFVWKSESNASDLTGYQYSVQFKSFLKNGWLVEVKHMDNDNRPKNLGLQLSYVARLGDEDKNVQEKPIFSRSMFKQSTMNGERLTPVRRNNRIIKEKNDFTISYR